MVGFLSLQIRRHQSRKNRSDCRVSNTHRFSFGLVGCIALNRSLQTAALIELKFAWRLALGQLGKFKIDARNGCSVGRYIISFENLQVNKGIEDVACDWRFICFVELICMFEHNDDSNQRPGCENLCRWCISR